MSASSDPVLSAIVDGLRNKDGCHTVILYGSHARGDASPESDYDIAAFRDQPGLVVRQAGWRGGALLDVFIYPATTLDAPDSSFLQIRGGRVLCQREHRGSEFLERLEAIHAAGPDPLGPGEDKALRTWAWKMLDRAGRGDVEGHHRRHWLLTALLEHHFRLAGVWYPGSKAALRSLEESDPRLYALFAEALEPGASLGALAALVEATSGDRPEA